MKLLFIVLSGIVAVTAQATSLKPETKVRHALVAVGEKTVSMASINKKLRKTQQFPEFFEVRESESAEEAFKRFGGLAKRFENTMKPLGKKYENLELSLGIIPTAVDTKRNQTCYVGFPSKVAEVATKLVSYEFTEQLFVWGIRHGQKVWLDDENQMETDILPEEWQNYDTKSDTVLMMGSYTDGGDDVNALIIKRCKE